MPFLTPIAELKEKALALEAALLSPTLSVKYADKARTYVDKASMRRELQNVYEALRAAGEMDPAGSRQIRPTNDSGW